MDVVAEYYAARAPEYDESAGYMDPVAEQRRGPIKERYRRLFQGHDVLEIACGTGFWTVVLAETARSVLAIDGSPTMLALARRRCARLPAIRFQRADAYSLEGVPADFSAALAVYWWSHMPKARIPAFLDVLHRRLCTSALVVLVDQLPYEAQRRRDRNGDLLETRILRDGRRYEIIKNFPSEAELRELLEGLAEEVDYTARPEEGAWTLTYRVLGGA